MSPKERLDHWLKSGYQLVCRRRKLNGTIEFFAVLQVDSIALEFLGMTLEEFKEQVDIVDINTMQGYLKALKWYKETKDIT